MICANQVPDHATIARFRVRHQEAMAGLFGQVLGLCAEAGLVRAGVIAVDGSKFAAAASDAAIRRYEEIAAEVLAEAAQPNEQPPTTVPRALQLHTSTRLSRPPATGVPPDQRREELQLGGLVSSYP